jgi:hypothetical protein
MDFDALCGKAWRRPWLVELRVNGMRVVEERVPSKQTSGKSATLNLRFGLAVRVLKTVG